MRKCRCWDMGLQQNMRYDELFALVEQGKYCSYEHGQYLCPTMDRELRRSEVERDRRKWYNKRLKRQGYSEEQIATMPQRRRRGKVANYEAVDLDL